MAVVLAIAVFQLPFTVLSDLRGVRADERLTPQAVNEARGPAAAAGTNMPLLRAARARIPVDASFAVVRVGRWGTAARPNRLHAFVWEAGESWTQYDLAPRVEVEQGRARWLLIRDGSPATIGLRSPMHAWRFGVDWLVELGS